MFLATNGIKPHLMLNQRQNIAFFTVCFHSQTETCDEDPGLEKNGPKNERMLACRAVIVKLHT
jgi:hypothetical protein